MMRRARGATLPEYALLVGALLTGGGVTFKALGTKVVNTANQTTIALSGTPTAPGGNGGGAGGRPSGNGTGGGPVSGGGTGANTPDGGAP